MAEKCNWVSVDAKRLATAVTELSLATQTGHIRFQERLRKGGHNSGELLSGFSQSNIKLMRRGERDWPSKLPHPLATIIYADSGIDITYSEVLEFFSELDFQIRLEFAVETQNDQPPCIDQHTLKDMTFEIQEARGTAVDPRDDDMELDLRIGFDRLRMSLAAPGIKATDNFMRAETPCEPGDGVDPDYTGHFRMRFAGRDPLSWVFTPKDDGTLLGDRVDAEGVFARIETDRAASLMTELSAAREALKVRVVEPGGRQRNSRSIAESHREKMIAAVARKSIAGAATEYVIYRKLVAGNSFT